MLNETIFQIILAASLAVLAIMRIYYRAKSGAFRESQFTEKESNWFLVLGIPASLTWLGSLLVWIINPEWMRWSVLNFPVGLRWSGVGLMVFALAAWGWIHHSLGRNFSPTLVVREHHQLITHGLYHWVRHSMYSAFFLFELGICLLTASWFIGLTGTLLILLIVVLRVPEEEAMMIETFGDQYREYIKHTGGLLPRFTYRQASSNPESL
ncbi:MAG: isoprenylcysteine carboxylmethyltransferase family protein [Leptolyngbya sp. UWPOB_LEPTO1]|uniref:methyltransferase family protein n=1 Tax=Leptolyngbya sp. UWPOB_LEPTO1 TaxID=2815653 RepID=UPI001AC65D10|nr:isoprenylcysteine carboxylmethyltransferase family protein [Leptolyngbya sp. UWPOB_LEPTO1]MBN8560186.1 isoprenylcysteine carboxylmethyltransferase family protein [Leptolyngbya sp. UWPOB_LEPTO1]